MIQSRSALWRYLSPEQQRLAADGAWLLEDRKAHPTQELSDYSYLVFPFAKLYEGFLKQLFRDLGIITEADYTSDHFRLGKVLSPNLARRLGVRSAYNQVARRFGDTLADHLWAAWKQGRNLVFHYFPHNYRALTLEQAQERIALTVAAMEEAVRVTHIEPRPHKK